MSSGFRGIISQVKLQIYPATTALGDVEGVQLGCGYISQSVLLIYPEPPSRGLMLEPDQCGRPPKRKGEPL